MPPEPPGLRVETHRALDPRVLIFNWIIALLLIVLASGLVWRQLVQEDVYHERERHQTERRVLIPGPRGDILDRNGRLLVGNRPRFALVIYLDELQPEFHREFIRIRKNYRATGDKDLPTYAQMEQIAHVSVVRNYLDQAAMILGRQVAVDAAALSRHFDRELLMPFVVFDDLSPEDFAKLLDRLPPSSPVQLMTTYTRYYPFGSAASHALGYVGAEDNVDPGSLPGGDLTTFRLRGSVGRDGLEKSMDARLQGRTGGAVYRVDQAGYKVNPPLAQRPPAKGADVTTSLDIDLQLAAEQAIGDQIGAAVAIDPRTGEVLALASKPDYDLNAFSPRLAEATADDIEKRGAWLDLATAGIYPPGSTFKTVVTIAGLLSGRLSPTDTSVTCEGRIRIGNRIFTCDNGEGHHGNPDLPEAIAESCDIYFYMHGLAIGPDLIAGQARRFRLDKPTGIELPNESSRMIIPDPAWKKRVRGETWTDGDTANMAIGQGYVQVTPMVMACYAASLARNETTTMPTLLHDPGRPNQHTEAIGLTPAQRAVLLAGMEGCTEGPSGTARTLQTDAMRIPGVRIAGKTGTAQYGNHLDVAWFICFAPIEDPRIALAVAVRSDAPGEGYQGGINGARVADAILKAFFERRPGAPIRGFPPTARIGGLPSPGSISRAP